MEHMEFVDCHKPDTLLDIGILKDRTEPSRYRLFRTKEDVIIFLPANFSEQFPVEVSRHQARANVVGSRAALS